MYAGAGYVFVRTGTAWTQQAYVKASNTRAGGEFATKVALSPDGNFLVVGSPGESSNATGVDGDQANTAAIRAGAVYTFGRTGGAWSQTAYIKASNTRGAALFGSAVAISGDGRALAVGSRYENSGGRGINGDDAENPTRQDTRTGAAYFFTRTDGPWSQQTYLKAFNPSGGARFGSAAAIAGSRLVIGAPGEQGGATGVNGDQTKLTAPYSGAVYVFR
jgi:hypothetical protein